MRIEAGHAQMSEGGDGRCRGGKPPAASAAQWPVKTKLGPTPSRAWPWGQTLRVSSSDQPMNRTTQRADAYGEDVCSTMNPAQGILNMGAPRSRVLQ
jgi:hypothetical protein